MNTCRTCLKTPATKHVSQLEMASNEDNKNFVDIMLFCLDIKVAEDPKITTSLCNNCYRKIISFYKFKVLSLKNDEYLRSLNPIVQLVGQKQSVYIDVNGIKHENPLEVDEYGPRLVEVASCNKSLYMDENGVKHENGLEADEFDCSDIEDSHAEIKTEVDVKDEDILPDVKIDAKDDDTLENVESDEEPLSALQRKESESIEEETKVKAPKKIKRGRPRKLNKEKKKIMRQMCQECGLSFWNLQEHSLQHQPKSERRKLKCKACPKLFLNAGDRKRHYKTTHLGLRKKCLICNKEVTRLGMHMARHKRPAVRLPCVTCKRTFVSQASLDVHMGMHANKYVHECDICHKTFRAKSLLLRHIRQVHKKEKKNQCELCPKAFFTKSGLREHKRTHSTKRLFECNECGLTLKTKRTLSTHISLVHCNVKKYHCDRCGKSFKAIAYLNFHMLTHTKEKKFECRFCGVRFGRSHHRSRHEFTAHQKKEDIK